METLRKLDQHLFGRYARSYTDLLERELVGTCESVLDVGCGASSPIREFSKKIPRTVGVDGFLPSIEKSRAQGIHSEYRQADLLKLKEAFEPRSFDGVIALDLIEHFSKEDGLRLLEAMETIARKKVIVFTPNGFLPQEPYDGNEYQRHVSGWEVREFEERGYRVYGVNGWKPLRGEWAAVRFKPEALWNRISWLTEPWVLNHPARAFQILAVREMQNS